MELEENREIPFLDVCIKGYLTTHFQLLYTVKRLSLVFTPSGSPLLLGSIRSISSEHLPIVAYASVQNPLYCSPLYPISRSLCFKMVIREVLLHCNYNVDDVLHKHKRKPSQPTLTVPKKDVILVLPYLGLHSDAITRRLKSCVNKFYGFVNLRVVFQNTRRIKSFFPYKDRFNRSQKSKIVYKASCWDCDAFYIGKTKRRLHDRKTEHFKALTQNGHASAVAKHSISTGHNIKWDHFEILASGQCDLRCKIKETLLIRDLKPALNENVGSENLLLYYFTPDVVSFLHCCLASYQYLALVFVFLNLVIFCNRHF